MASRTDVTYSIGADTTQANRQINQFIQRTQRQINNAPLRLRLDTRGFHAPLGRISADLNQFQNSMDASIARTLAFGASVSVIGGVAKAFKDLVATTVRVEEALAKINVLLNLSQKDLAKFAGSLFDVAKNTAQSFDQVAEAAAEFSRQGLSAAETTKRVNDALILTRLSGLDATKSVESLTAAVNGFKKEALSTTEIVNRLANVDAAFAVSSADLAGALSRAGAVSQDAKVKFNELLAATTAVQQATARGGNVIGNGFKTIFTRLQRSKVLGELEKIGVATKTSTGDIRGAIDILRDYAQVYKTLGDEQKAFTAEQVAGVFQINTLKAFINDLSSEFGVYNRALVIANNTSDEAIQRNEKLNETLQSILSQTGTEFEKLGDQIGSLAFEDNFKGLLDVLKGGLESLTGVLDSEGIGGTIGRGIIKGIGSFLTGPGLLIIGAASLKLLQFIGRETATAFKQVLEIGSKTQERRVAQERINQLLQQDNQLLHDILNSNGSIEARNRAVEASIQRQNDLLQFQRNLVNTLSAAVTPNAIGGLDVRRPGGGRRGRGAAEGFVPNLVMSEKRSISKGVGGARSGDKPVVIPNFNLGGGKKTTMVAHTGEHIVPNFANGGSAIFNRDMVKSMGLPAGAKKIGAAGGFIPNFDNPADRLAKLKNSIANKKADGKSNIEIIKDISGSTSNSSKEAKRLTDLGFTRGDIELAKPNIKFGVESKSRKIKEGAVIFDASTVKAFMAVPTGSGDIDIRANSQKTRDKFRGYDGFKGKYYGADAPTSAKNVNSSKGRMLNRISGIGDALDQAMAEAANHVVQAVAPNDTVPNLSKITANNLDTILKEGGKGGVVAAKGAFFEGVVAAVLAGAKGGENTGTLDISITNQKGEDLLRDIFNSPEGYRHGDFKATASRDNKEKFASQVIKNLAPPRAAGGYIPNFANISHSYLNGVKNSPAGKRAMSTERALTGSAKMGYDSRIGFGVYNNSQRTLSNAINQHISNGDSLSSLPSMGAGAQGMDAARGLIPNFAPVAGVGAFGRTPTFNLTFQQMTTAMAKGTQQGVNKSQLNKAAQKQRGGLSGQQVAASQQQLRAQADQKARDIEASKERRSQKFQQASFGASIGLNILGGIISEKLSKSGSFDTRLKGEVLGSSIQGASSGALVGGAFGPIGSAIGAVVGASAPWLKLLDKTKIEYDRQSEALQKLIEGQTASENAITQYISTVEQLNNTTDPTTIASLNDQLAQVSQNIPTGSLNELKNAGSSIENLKQAFLSITQSNLAEKVQGRARAASAAEGDNKFNLAREEAIKLGKIVAGTSDPKVRVRIGDDTAENKLGVLKELRRDSSKSKREKLLELGISEDLIPEDLSGEFGHKFFNTIFDSVRSGLVNERDVLQKAIDHIKPPDFENIKKTLNTLSDIAVTGAKRRAGFANERLSSFERFTGQVPDRFLSKERKREIQNNIKKGSFNIKRASGRADASTALRSQLDKLKGNEKISQLDEGVIGKVEEKLSDGNISQKEIKEILKEGNNKNSEAGRILLKHSDLLKGIEDEHTHSNSLLDQQNKQQDIIAKLQREAIRQDLKRNQVQDFKGLRKSLVNLTGPSNNKLSSLRKKQESAQTLLQKTELAFGKEDPRTKKIAKKTGELTEFINSVNLFNEISNVRIPEGAKFDSFQDFRKKADESFSRQLENPNLKESERRRLQGSRSYFSEYTRQPPSGQVNEAIKQGEEGAKSVTNSVISGLNESSKSLGLLTGHFDDLSTESARVATLLKEKADALEAQKKKTAEMIKTGSGDQADRRESIAKEKELEEKRKEAQNMLEGIHSVLEQINNGNLGLAIKLSTEGLTEEQQGKLKEKADEIIASAVQP